MPSFFRGNKAVLFSLLLTALAALAISFAWRDAGVGGVVVLALALIVMGLGALLCQHQRWRQQEEVAALATALKEMGATGDYGRRLEPSPFFAVLGEELNLLLAEVDNGRRDMAKLQGHLESRVASRTAALETVNRRLFQEKARADMATMVKSDFLANMSHELRTPMNGIIAACDLASEEKVSPKIANYLRIIQESSQALLMIVRDTLDFSQLEAGDLALDITTFPLARLTTGLEETFRPRAEQEQLSLVVSASHDIPPLLRGDLARLQQIIDNLVDNGLKFTRQGAVTVNFSCQERQGDTVMLVVKVADTGIGMEQASMERIFDAFHQEDSSKTREFGGAGLGLAISQRLAKMMGGSISVAGEEGQGCVFTVRVRLGCQANGAPLLVAGDGDEGGAPKGELDLSGRHVLLVEDDEINRGIIEALLTGLGVTVDTAIDGQQGVDKVVENLYDAVFMDMQMPVLNGFQAIEQIRDLPQAGDLPIIALTAHALEHDRERCLEAGADDYISKPVNRQQISQVLLRFFAVEEPLEPQELPPGGGEDEQEPLPDLGAVDRAAAIVRLGVERDVYERVVKTFCNDYREFGERLLPAHGGGDQKGLETMLHSLKGSSGTVGAQNLSAYALELEGMARAGNQPTADELAELLTGLTQVLAGFADLDGPEGEVEASPQAAALSEEEVLAILEELAESLDQSIYDNINSAFKRLESGLAVPEVATLGQMIRVYQYDEALALVGALLADLKGKGDGDQANDESSKVNGCCPGEGGD
ncbi:MAG: response regulator [Thermodesulfobacteriota bacterium]